MNFTLEGRILKFIDENHIFIKKHNNIQCWKELDIYNRYGYNFIAVNKVNYRIHRIIGYLFLGLDIDDTTQHIDHINGIRDDNRLENLRVVNIKQNNLNRHTDNGYTFNKRYNKYQSRIHKDRKVISLGYYDTKEEARQAYLDAKEVYHIIS